MNDIPWNKSLHSSNSLYLTKEFNLNLAEKINKYQELVVNDWIQQDEKLNSKYHRRAFAVSNDIVSLIMMTRNRKDIFLETIESLHNNTEHPFELIICDSDSREPGKREAIISLLDDNRISSAVLTTGGNTGMGDIWNRATARCLGEYICLLNDDLYFEKGWLKEQVQCLETFPEIGIMSGFGTNYWHTPMQLENVPFDWNWGIAKRNSKIITVIAIPTGSQMLFRRSLLDKIGDYDPSLSWTVDMDFAIRAFENNSYFGMTQKAYVIHRHDIPKTWEEDGAGHGTTSHQYPLVFGNLKTEQNKIN